MKTQLQQRIVNRVVSGLARQGFKQSMDEEGEACLYRSPDGLKCGIGQIISDKNYNYHFEGNGADDTSVMRAVAATLNVDVDELDGSWLYKLQGCHDKSANPSGMKKILKRFIKEHDLKVPPQLQKS